MAEELHIPEKVREALADLRTATYVVIPAYNEVRSIADVVREVAGAYPNVVVVDDGSSDGTDEAVRHLIPHVVRHPVNRGQGAALQTGIEYALRRGAQYIVTFDADGQHRVEDIADLLAPLVAGECDIALGSRFLGNAALDMPRSRWILLKLAIGWTRVVSRVNLTDTHNGLRAFSRRAAEKIQITMDRMAHASELLDCIRQMGLPYQEVPVQIRYTEYSLAKGQRPHDAIRILTDYLVGRVIR